MRALEQALGNIPSSRRTTCWSCVRLFLSGGVYIPPEILARSGTKAVAGRIGPLGFSAHQLAASGAGDLGLAARGAVAKLLSKKV